VTVPEVTAEPIWVAPWKTKNVTVPSLTVPPPLVATVALRVTDCEDVENVAVAFAAVVVVEAALTVRVEVAELLAKFASPMKEAVIG
jgi:hypothetical protein